jgi:putative hydrolase of the HAD superfamily
LNIRVLFTDIGGVLLTNGWDVNSRALAAKKFKLDLNELNERHGLMFDTFEEGKLTLREYLKNVIFFRKRNFTHGQFRDFMFAQSKPFNDMIRLTRSLKSKYNLKVIAISNECRELNDYRIKKYKLDSFIDAFISSCYVHLRKPDKDIYKMALDIFQTKPNESVFTDDRLLFVETAESMGIKAIHHTEYNSTVRKFAKLGLKL